MELAFKTWWGRVILGVLTVVLLPLIIYVWARQALAIRKTRRDLEELSARWPYFKWPAIERQVRAGVRELYREWSTGKLDSCREFLTPEYFESQQDLLDRWTEEGKRNVTELKKLSKVAPLAVHVENEHRHSIIPVLITMDLIDYLEDVNSGKVIKGKKGKVKESHDAIWVMLYTDGVWRLHSIEAGDESLIYASEANELETHFLERQVRAPAPTSYPAAVDLSADVPATEEEEPVVRVGEDEDHDRRPAEVDERSEEKA